MNGEEGVSAGYDVDVLRGAEFPWTSDTVYLNNASIGPLPERTRLTLEQFNRRRATPHLLPDRQALPPSARSSWPPAAHYLPGLPKLRVLHGSLK